MRPEQLDLFPDLIRAEVDVREVRANVTHVRKMVNKVLQGKVEVKVRKARTDVGSNLLQYFQGVISPRPGVFDSILGGGLEGVDIYGGLKMRKPVLQLLEVGQNKPPDGGEGPGLR